MWPAKPKTVTAWHFIEKSLPIPDLDRVKLGGGE
jgi:hypothetical protein